jgi:hypothetical protein
VSESESDSNPAEGPKASSAPTSATGPAMAASSGSSGGGLLGSILRGLGPVVRNVIRSTTRATTARRSTLQLRYHDGGANRWGSASVTYARKGSRVTVLSSPTASWWHHVRSGGKVQVRIRQTWFDGFARVVSKDEDTWTRAVNLFVTARGAAAARRAGLPVKAAGRAGTSTTSGRSSTASGPVVIWIELDRTP